MSSVAAEHSPMAISPLQMAADALDQLEREELDGMPALALGEQVEGLFTIFNRTAAAISRRLAAFDRSRGCAAYDAHSTAA